MHPPSVSPRKPVVLSPCYVAIAMSATNNNGLGEYLARLQSKLGKSRLAAVPEPAPSYDLEEKKEATQAQALARDATTQTTITYKGCGAFLGADLTALPPQAHGIQGIHSLLQHHCQQECGAQLADAQDPLLQPECGQGDGRGHGARFSSPPSPPPRSLSLPNKSG